MRRIGWSSFVWKRLFFQALLLVFAPVAARGAAPTTRPLVLHIPGVGGFMDVDRSMLHGLELAGVDADFRYHDWTVTEHGVPALHDYSRNQRDAEGLAQSISVRHHAYPDGTIYLTAHSGGCAIAVWALEKLPPGSNVDVVLLMAPALSPQYDLSKALEHVRGSMHVFWSDGDYLILGLGCKLCGTMDQVHTYAAGYVGLKMPPSGDAIQYKKLIQHPYNTDWIQLYNFGDHIGPMSTPFAARVLAPLLVPASNRQTP